MTKLLKQAHKFEWDCNEILGATEKDIRETLIEALENWIADRCGQKLTPYTPTGLIDGRIWKFSDRKRSFWGSLF